MREILFRGKAFDNRWVEGLLVWIDHNDETALIRKIGKAGVGYFDFLVEFETVGQFTGLTDKNGKKIFENGYMIIDNKTYKVIFDNAEYILTNIFNCDIITLKNNSIKGVFVDEI